jgi:hypothetical protein
MGNYEYKYWSISECELDVYLYNILAPLDLGFDENITWDEFKNTYPHWTYAWIVRNDFMRLLYNFQDIQAVQKMFRIDKFPINSNLCSINRYDFMRITLDLLLYRVSSVRDLLLHVVNSTYEYNLDSRNVNIRTIRKLCKFENNTIYNLLDNVNNIGAELRDERNLLAHQGITRDSFHERVAIMRHVALFEKEINKSVIIEGQENYDIKQIFEKEMKIIYEQFINTMDELNKAVINTLDILALEFINRYHIKSNNLSLTFNRV